MTRQTLCLLALGCAAHFLAWQLQDHVVLALAVGALSLGFWIAAWIGTNETNETRRER